MKISTTIDFKLLGLTAEAIVEMYAIPVDDTIKVSLDCITLISLAGQTMEVEICMDDLPNSSYKELQDKIDAWAERESKWVLVEYQQQQADQLHDLWKNDYEA